MWVVVIGYGWWQYQTSILQDHAWQSMSWGHATGAVINEVNSSFHKRSAIAFKTKPVKTFVFWYLGVVVVSGCLWWLIDYISSWGTTRMDTCILLGNGSVHLLTCWHLMWDKHMKHQNNRKLWMKWENVTNLNFYILFEQSSTCSALNCIFLNFW